MMKNADAGHVTQDINHKPRRIHRWALSAALAAGALGGLAAAVPAPASVAVQSTETEAVTSYGETPQFHCGTGQVVLDNIRIPNAELPVSWEAFVYYYGSNGTWYPYAQMYTAAPSAAWETISSAVANTYYQQKMYASVPHGYYYAVRVYMVPNASLGYQAHWDWASLSYGYGTGTSCVA